jgi:transcriptional regulator with XRE-family HTH domain
MPLLLTRCRETLSLSQAQLATLVGSSVRTVQRWENDAATPSAWHVHRLADAVRSLDESLARDLDLWAPRPQAPPPPPAPPAAAPAPQPPPPPPPPPPIAADVLVDSVVCAAAEAVSLAPQAVRPAVLAAFARARDARLTIDAVIEVLEPPAHELAAGTGAAKRRG